MANSTRQLRWRVQVDLSGCLGERVHEDLTGMGMTVTCANGGDTIVHWSPARTAAAASSGMLLTWLNPRVLRAVEITRVDTMSAERWESEQREDPGVRRMLEAIEAAE